SFTSALQRADDLLYAAKRRGRNCTVAGHAQADAGPGLAAFRDAASGESSTHEFEARAAVQRG
ncbi:UNVERIFIED_CONTAM: hypothetical protein LJD30_25595, partial [Raoultella ornithinolytica]